MARTKKQTLEKATERKRQIQEELQRELQRKASCGDGGSSQPAAPASTSPRSKGKHRTRADAASSSGAISPASAPSPPAQADHVSSSTRRKADHLRGKHAPRADSKATVSMSSSLLAPACRKQTEVSPTSSKKDMPKAVVRLPDIYREPTKKQGKLDSSPHDKVNTEHKDHSKIPTRRSDVAMSDSSSSVGNQKGRRSRSQDVKESLKSLKEASELVREEKKRSSRQRSPASSNQEVSESLHSSPERRSPRQQSPSHSTESKEQKAAARRKKSKRTAFANEDRPAINIFTDNIGVDLGKRIRSPRRLSEDMIPLPIFSARRWSNLPREAIQGADKIDGDDKDSFKAPLSLSPTSAIKKFNDAVPQTEVAKVFSSDAIVLEHPEENFIGRKPPTTKCLKKLHEVDIAEDSAKKFSKVRNNAPDHETFERLSRKDTLHVRSIGEPSSTKSPKKAAHEKVQEKESSSVTKNNAAEKIENSVKDAMTNKETCGKVLDTPKPGSTVFPCDSKGEKKTNEAESSNCHEVMITSGIKDVTEDINAVLSQPNVDSITKDDQASSSPKTILLDSVVEQSKSREGSPLKTGSKKIKLKSFTRNLSGERKKKQAPMDDETLSSICRDMMSGVIISPIKQKSETDQGGELSPSGTEKKEATAAIDIVPNKFAPVSNLFQPSFLVPDMYPKGTSPHSGGLLQPAKNILMSFSNVVSTSSNIITSSSLPVTASTTPLSVSCTTVNTSCSYSGSHMSATFSNSETSALMQKSEITLSKGKTNSPSVSPKSLPQHKSPSLDDSLVEATVCPEGMSKSQSEISLQAKETPAPLSASSNNTQTSQKKEVAQSSVVVSSNDKTKIVDLISASQNTKSFVADTCDTTNVNLTVISETEAASQSPTSKPEPIVRAEPVSPVVGKTDSAVHPSLLCAMLVGGSEVADSYEKSKPAVVGPHSSKEDNSQFHKGGEGQSSTPLTVNPTISHEGTSEVVSCDSVSEKQTLSTSASHEKSKVDEVITENLDLEVCIKETVAQRSDKKDLKIDIASKLKGLNENVLRLLEIDVEEDFLSKEHVDHGTEEEEVMDVKQDEEGFKDVDSQVEDGKAIKPSVETGDSNKPSVKEEAEGSPLFGVIANLAARLKSTVKEDLSTDIDEILSTCPKSKPNILLNVDEKARKNTLQKRLEEAILKDKQSPVTGEYKTTHSNENISKSSFLPCDTQASCGKVEESSYATTDACFNATAGETVVCGEQSLPETAEQTKEEDVKLPKEKDITCQEKITPGSEVSMDSKHENLPVKHPFQKSKTFECLYPKLPADDPTSLKRVNSSPQLDLIGHVMDMSKSKDLMKSKLGSKIPVAGTSSSTKPVKKSWRTPRIIVQPKPLSILSELEESSSATTEKNVFTCTNLQKYLNMPSNRMIIPPHKRKEMEQLDAQAQKAREEGLADKTDKELAEKMIHLEYLKYEPDFDEVEGLLFMSFSSEAEIIAHTRVEKAFHWDEDGTMLKIAQAKAFEEAKSKRGAMDGVKLKHLRGQHMRWKKYRRLYSGEVRSIIQGVPSMIEEELGREARHGKVFKTSRKTSDPSKLKGSRHRVSGEAKSTGMVHSNSAGMPAKSAGNMLPTPKSANIPSSLQVPDVDSQFIHRQFHLPTSSHQLGAESCFDSSNFIDWTDSNTSQLAEDNTPPQSSILGKRRIGFSHQREHRLLFKELNMDWEDRMIHRKLGGWSLKGNRPQAFSQAAQKRKAKELLLTDVDSSTSNISVPGEPATPTIPGEFKAPSTNTSPEVETSPSKDGKKKSCKLIFPMISEKMAKNAASALVWIGRKKSASSKKSKSRSGLPSLRPILPYPSASGDNTSHGLVPLVKKCYPPVIGCNSSNQLDGREKVPPAGSSLAATIGSPAVSDLSNQHGSIALTTPSPASLAGNPALSTPASITSDAKEDVVMEGVDTAADVVSSPSIADSSSTKSCGKPGCRYGCICHLCSVGETPTLPPSPVAKRLASKCDKEYCRLGCICESLDPEKPIPESSHCSKPTCMFSCICLKANKNLRHGGDGTNLYQVGETSRRKRKKGKSFKGEYSDGLGSDSDIPYLPSMKRRPKQGERFSNLPQRERTHRSAKNLDAITRKALMMYDTSEIYCEKVERVPRREKDFHLGCSGVLDDDDFTMHTSLAGPEIAIEYDCPIQEDMPYKLSEESDQHLHQIEEPIDPYHSFAKEQPDSQNSFENYEEPISTVPHFTIPHKPRKECTEQISFVVDEERLTFPIVEPSAHKRKRKSHPLSNEIFTFSTCARTQPYKRKPKKDAAYTSGTIGPQPFNPNMDKNDSRTTASSKNAPSTGCIDSSEASQPRSQQVPLLCNSEGSSFSDSAANTSKPKALEGPELGGNDGNTAQNARPPQNWHISMVCLKARGPPPAAKEGTEEDDVHEEDEVKLLEFAANCNWEGARKEILGRVAQCLTRGQYPKPRTMNICEFVVEILPKAPRPSVIPTELREKLPGKMYSIRVRITRRREMLPQASSDTCVIDLRENSPRKSVEPSKDIPKDNPVSVQKPHFFSQPHRGISGLSKLQLALSVPEKSASAPSSRRSSTEVSQAFPSMEQSANTFATLIHTKQQAPSKLKSVDTSLASVQFTHSSAVSISSPSIPALLSLASTPVEKILNTSTSVSLLTPDGSPVVQTTESTTPTTSVSVSASGKHTKPFSLLNFSSASTVAGARQVAPITADTTKNPSSVVKYVKIKDKDGLVKMVGIDKKNKIVTTPYTAAHQQTRVPIMAVPVCGPTGTTIVPILTGPLSPSLRLPTSVSSTTKGAQPVLLRIPNSQKRGPVLFRPSAGGQFPPGVVTGGKSVLNPVAISKSLSGGSKQTILLPISTASDKKTSLASGKREEVILTFDAAHIKKLESLKKAQVAAKTPSTTVVTSTLGVPIMSTEIGAVPQDVTQTKESRDNDPSGIATDKKDSKIESSQNVSDKDSKSVSEMEDATVDSNSVSNKGCMAEHSDSALNKESKSKDSNSVVNRESKSEDSNSELNKECKGEELTSALGKESKTEESCKMLLKHSRTEELQITSNKESNIEKSNSATSKENNVEDPSDASKNGTKNEGDCVGKEVNEEILNDVKDQTCSTSKKPMISVSVKEVEKGKELHKKVQVKNIIDIRPVGSNTQISTVANVYVSHEKETEEKQKLQHIMVYPPVGKDLVNTRRPSKIGVSPTPNPVVSTPQASPHLEIRPQTNLPVFLMMPSESLNSPLASRRDLLSNTSLKSPIFVSSSTSLSSSSSASPQVKVIKCTSSEVKETKCTSSELKETKCTSSELKETKCTSSEVKETKCTSSEVKETKCTSSEVKETKCTSPSALSPSNGTMLESAIPSEVSSESKKSSTPGLSKPTAPLEKQLTAPSGKNKKQQGLPAEMTTKELHSVREEAQSNTSCPIPPISGQRLETTVNPMLNTVLNTDRPNSSLSASLSTTSSDNMMISLSSDESDIDVGEDDKPELVMASQGDAEKALENDHDYLWIRSDSPVTMFVEAQKVLRNQHRKGSLHNQRERERRLEQRSLFEQLQASVCSVLGKQKIISKVRILDEAKQCVALLQMKDEQNMIRLRQEENRRIRLQEQLKALKGDLSTEVTTEAMEATTDKAVKRHRKRQAFFAKLEPQTSEATHSSLSSEQAETDDHALSQSSMSLYQGDSEKNNREWLYDISCVKSKNIIDHPVAGGLSVKVNLSEANNPALTISSSPTLRLSPAISVLAGREEAANLVSSMSGEAMFEESQESGSKKQAPSDTVDLISSSASEVDDRAYEDISEPEEEEKTLPQNTHTASSGASQGQEQIRYEDISDAEEARPSKYEDISDIEETGTCS